MEPVMTEPRYEKSLTTGLPKCIGERVVIPLIIRHRVCHGGGGFAMAVPVGIYVIEQDVEYFFPLSEKIRDFPESAAFCIDEAIEQERRRHQGSL